MNFIDTTLTWVIIALSAYGVFYFLTNRSLNGIMGSVVSKVRSRHCSNEIEGTSLGKTTTNLTFGTDPATNNRFNHLPSLPVAGSFPHDNKDKTIEYSQQGRSTYQSSSHI